MTSTRFCKYRQSLVGYLQRNNLWKRADEIERIKYAKLYHLSTTKDVSFSGDWIIQALHLDNGGHIAGPVVASAEEPEGVSLDTRSGSMYGGFYSNWQMFRLLDEDEDPPKQDAMIAGIGSSTKPSEEEIKFIWSIRPVTKKELLLYVSSPYKDEKILDQIFKKGFKYVINEEHK